MTSSTMTSTDERVLVVDFGAQYAQLIARRVREANVYSEIVAPTVTASEVTEAAPVGVILSGGPASVNTAGAPRLDPDIYDLDVPVLGICYGAQLMAEQLGGIVGRNERGEYGRTKLTHNGGLLLKDIASPQDVWMSHFDAITQAPPGATVTAVTDEAPVAAFEDKDRGLFAVQFHPEVEHTPCGPEVIRRFLTDACNAKRSWSPASQIDSLIEQIHAQVGEGRAICGLSGGVDSAVAAALVHRAIGDRLTCVLVDTGLLRQNEAADVVDAFTSADINQANLIQVDASEQFFAALEGVTDPEEKRRTIGELFIRTFEKARAESDPDARYLVQGTLYPDVIESGTAHAATIKSHHNVGGLPDDVDFEIVEPLRTLFKDEVRAIGTELGLPDDVVHRQPFPGPGLAVRIIGEVTPAKAETLRHADAIVRAELRAAGLEREIWQSFAVLADIRTVGVMGDERTYGHPIIVRAVTGSDAMTADWARIGYDVLERISTRIVAEVAGVNRVTYDITSKPPATIEWE